MANLNGYGNESKMAPNRLKLACFRAKLILSEITNFGVFSLQLTQDWLIFIARMTAATALAEALAIRSVCRRIWRILT